MADLVTLISGMVVLIVGADLLVRGAAWTARALGLSKMLVGLTLVAFGTSAPELVVCILAALDNSHGLATGTVLGSNAANIGLIVGSAALVQPIARLPGGAAFELRFAIAAGIAPLVPMAFGTPIQRWLGAVFLAVAVLFTFQLVSREQRRKKIAASAGAETEDRVVTTPGEIAKNAAFVAIGLLGLVFGGNWLVDGASGIALSLGVSKQLVGVLIVAIGTSLPELATSVMAARSGNPEIALGNVLGSNIFNIFLVLGATALIAPVPIAWAAEGRIALLGLLYIVTLAILLARARVSRMAGFGLLLAYAVFMVLFPPTGS